MTGGFDLEDLDQVFFAECEDYLQSADSLLSEGDLAAEGREALEVLERCAHSIKGAALTLGFTGLGALASALERCLSAAMERGAIADAALVCEGFAALRENLAGLRAGGSKTLGGSPDLLARLACADVAPRPALRSVVFRLSATGAAAPVLFDDMLDALRERGRVAVLQAPWDDPERTCRVELDSTLADRALIEIIERVAEPGSVCIDSGAAALPLVEAAQPVIGAAESAHVGRAAAGVGFSVGSRRFVAYAPDIDEIVGGGTVFPPPSGSAWVCGSIEFDGVFIPVIDLQRCLRLGNGKVGPSSMQLVSRVAGEAVAVLVDDVESVFRLDDGAVQPVGAVIQRTLPVGVRGVLKRDGEAVWVLDLPGLLEACIGVDDAR